MTAAIGRLLPRGSAAERVAFGLIGFVGVVALWEAAVGTGALRRSLLGQPSRILAAAQADFGSGAIWPHITTSLAEFASGFVVALVIGIPLGMAIGWFPRVDAFMSGLIAGLNATPNVALIPLIVLIAGIGLESKAIVVFLSAFFAVMVTTYAGIRAVARRHLEITQSFGGSRWLAFRRRQRRDPRRHPRARVLHRPQRDLPRHLTHDARDHPVRRVRSHDRRGDPRGRTPL